MTKERFFEIMREEGFPEGALEEAWRTRPSDDLDEARLRRLTREVVGEVQREGRASANN